MNDYTIYISALSLLVSLVVLYLTQLQKPKVTLHVGSTLGFCHKRTGFEMFAPITFLNSAHRAGLASKCSVLITFPNTPTKFHYVEWSEFREHDNDKKLYFREDFAGPLPIAGKSSESRMVSFEWKQGSVAFGAGVYQLTFYVWLSGTGRPEIASSHVGELSAQDATDLAKFKTEESSQIRFFTVDQEIERNKLLTLHEVKTLLGQRGAFQVAHPK